MKTLKFDHDYAKIPDKISAHNVRLLAAIRVHRDELSQQFIEYDTMYFTKHGHVKHYDLSTDKTFLMLILGSTALAQTPIWTTLRRDTKENRDKWLPEVGKIIKCEIRTDEMIDFVASGNVKMEVFRHSVLIGSAQLREGDLIEFN